MKNMKKFIAILLSAILVISGVSFAPSKGTDAAAKSGEKIVVSLGDSYSSGEGIEPFFGQDNDNAVKTKDEDWLAHRSQLAWSGQLKINGVSGTLADHKDTNWFFRASSGAKTNHFYEGQDKTYKRGDYSGTCKLTPQLEVFDTLEAGSVDYVTVTIGGNDMGFVEIVSSAITGSEDSLKKALDDVWTKFSAKGGIRDNIKKAYNDIAAKAGSQATIIVAGYPKFLNPEGFKVVSFIELPVSVEKVALVNDSVEKFNAELDKLVAECRSEGLNIVFADVQKEFEGHEAYTSEPYFNGIITKIMPEDLSEVGMVSSYSIHPNADGAKAYARAVQKVVDDLEAGKYDGGKTEPAAPSTVSVTSSALKKAKANISVYLGTTALEEKAFKVSGKADGKKQTVYYVPAKAAIEAAGGKYTFKSKKATIKLGGVTLTFKQGKNSYTVTYKDSNGKKTKITLKYGKSTVKNDLLYIPVSIIEEVSGLVGAKLSANVEKSKLYLSSIA